MQLKHLNLAGVDPEMNSLGTFATYMAALKLAAGKVENAKEAAELRAKLEAAERAFTTIKAEWLSGINFQILHGETHRTALEKRPTETLARRRQYLADFDYATLMMQVRSSERELFDTHAKSMEDLIREGIAKGIQEQLPAALEKERRHQAEATALQQRITELQKQPGLDAQTASKVNTEKYRQEELKGLKKQLSQLANHPSAPAMTDPGTGTNSGFAGAVDSVQYQNPYEGVL